MSQPSVPRYTTVNNPPFVLVVKATPTLVAATPPAATDVPPSAPPSASAPPAPVVHVLRSENGEILGDAAIQDLTDGLVSEEDGGMGARAAEAARVAAKSGQMVTFAPRQLSVSEQTAYEVRAFYLHSLPSVPNLLTLFLFFLGLVVCAFIF